MDIASIYYAPPQGASIRMTNVTLFINGMHLEVQQGTVLSFNPMSSSQERLAQMRDVQFHVGRITFQTRQRLQLLCPTPFLTPRPTFHLSRPISTRSKK